MPILVTSSVRRRLYPIVYQMGTAHERMASSFVMTVTHIDTGYRRATISDRPRPSSTGIAIPNA
jgi:hypothetical protein